MKKILKIEAPKTANARQKLLEAALRVFRERGYAGTSVDELCAAAGVTKGAFFHHFASKEQLAVAAAEYFQARAEELFNSEPCRRLPTAADRLLGYVEQRKKLLRGELPEYTCLLGTLVQEVYETHPAIREVCNRAMFDHAAWLEADVRAAMRECGVQPGWSAKSLAAHILSVIQGGLVLAKAQSGPAVTMQSLDHLHRYLETLFAVPSKKRPGLQARRQSRVSA